jgi:molybdopterin-guanine dinucleotide biosynthesis protein A
VTSTGFEAVVLAGGKSTRLGRDKAAEVLAGVSLLQRVVWRVEGLVGRIVVVRARGQTLPLVQSSTSLVEVDDLYPDSGPLGGIITGLANLDTGAAFVTACDMPLVQPALVSALLGRSKGDRAVVPIAGGRRQPLCAVYARACAPVLERRLRSGDLRLLDALADLDVLEVQPETWRAFDPRGLSFLNINDESDLRAV